MSGPLAIDIELVTGSYEAQLADREPEWPPHPYRVFAALVAAAGASPTPAEEECLVAMADLGAPVIYAPKDVWPTKKYKVWVPGSTTAKGEEKTYVKQPVFANRAMVVGTPKVRFEWPSAGSVDHAVLAGLLGRIGHLGRCGGIVVAGIGDVGKQPEGTSTWVPDEHGKSLRVASRRALSSMRSVYARNMGDYPNYVWHRYRRADEDVEDVATGPWKALCCYRLSGTPDLQGTDALAICGAVRSASLKALGRLSGEKGAEWSGHDADGKPTCVAHVAWVPLVFADAQYANGRVLGVGVALPERVAAPPIPDEISFGGHSYSVESTADLLRVPWTLQEERWVRPSRAWATVTPIALPKRHGRKKVRGKDGTLRIKPRRRLTDEEVGDEIAAAFTEAGFPMPAEVRAGPGPMVTGSEPARNYLSRRRPDEMPRRLAHAIACFDQPVSGPVMVGFYRHFGLGLLAPIDEDDL